MQFRKGPPHGGPFFVTAGLRVNGVVSGISGAIMEEKVKTQCANHLEQRENWDKGQGQLFD